MNPRPADSLKIALAQLNPTVGDVTGNADKVRRARDEAAAMGADVVAFPELFIAGYPPEDLVLKPAFKVDLPNYGVFDEKRLFAPGPMPGPVLIKGVRIGIPICEDIWDPEVVECLSETGGEILLVPNGSPYWRGKTEHRLNIAVARVVDSGLPLIYLNMLGGQD